MSSPKSKKPGSGGAAEPRKASRSSTRAPGRPGPRQARSDEASGDTILAPMRIAKAMAKAGLCSRREAERWIEDGRVNVNGKTLETAAFTVSSRDRILVDGAALPAMEPPRLWRYHKPKGLVTTHRDPEGRPTVFDALPETLPRVISVGRLDFNTEGLLLLTTDGDLARHLELPSTGWLRRYRVRAHGRVTEEDLAALSDGIVLDGVRYGPVEARIESTRGGNVWLSVALREGKNREVRKILKSLDLDVNRLIRVSFGPFQLNDLAAGDVEIVRRKVLTEQLGRKLAGAFGLNSADPDSVPTKTITRRKPARPKTTTQPRKAADKSSSKGR